MNLPLAATADINVGFSFPAWILWGIAFAAVLTIGLNLSVYLLDRGSVGRYGFDSDSGFRVVSTFFVTYGLIPGLLGSLLAYYTNWLWGSALILVVLVVMMYGHHRLEVWNAKGKPA